MLTFRHAGDIGDLIYALPVVRHFGGGVMLIEAANYTRVPLTRDKWCGIDLLLLQQPYISGVEEWRKGFFTNYNLNDFRARMHQTLRLGHGREKHLCQWMLETHGVPLTAADTSWLKVEPNPVAKVIFSRSGVGRANHHIYHNPRFPWHAVWAKYGKDAAFVGTRMEYEVFRGACGEVPFAETPNLLEAARIIAGAQLFVGNQSAPHAIAEGLKQRILLEVWPEGPNCLINRPGVVHGWDENVALPDL